MRGILKVTDSSGCRRKIFPMAVTRRTAHSTTQESGNKSASVNNEEIKKFSAVGKDWWNAESNRGTGPLHAMNPVRVDFIRRTLAAQLSLHSLPPNLQLQGLDILDVGCGGGILSEALARLGANVTSIDPSDVNIAVASRHSRTDPSTSKIDYMRTTVEEIARSDRKFDVVCSLEVIEHVETPMAFVTACSSLLKSGGSLYLSTINRNLKSFGVAIVGAEYILNMLPPGTHDWHKFITPKELTMMVETGQSGMSVLKKEGIVMSINPMNGNFVWHLDPNDLGINFILHAVKSK
jgi:2-polyprenyl-6-hydroxyphenyl methylase / 3-demethylubiquinone-9 3-methyltransferase